MQRTVTVGQVLTVSVLLFSPPGSLSARTVTAVQECEHPEEPTSTAPRLRQANPVLEVRSLLAALDRAQNAGDLDAFLELVDDDVVYMPPDAPSIEGGPAVADFYRTFFDAMRLRMRHDSEETLAAGSLVINRGRAVGTMRPASGGEWLPFDNKYLYVLRRGEDGKLRFGWVIYNAGPETGEDPTERTVRRSGEERGHGTAAAQKSVAISADGVPIRYVVRGEPGDAPTLVLVHGWSTTHQVWEPHLTSLAETQQVVALDLAGFGESGMERSDWSMEAFGADVAAVIRELHAEDVVLVGYSLGGVAAIEAALQVPERVAGVILVDILHDPDRGFAEERVQRLVQAYRAGWYDRDWIRSSGLTAASPDSLVDRYLAMVPEVPPDSWWISLEEVFHWMDRDVVHSLQRLQVPLGAINSDRVPTDVPAFRRHDPGFVVRIMPDLGHLGVMWEKTDLFDQHVRELAVSLSSDDDPVAPDADPEAELLAVLREIEAAFNANDLDRLMASVHEQAVWLPPGEPPLEGKAAVREFYAGLLRDYRLEIHPEFEEVLLEEHLAVVRARLPGRLLPRAGGLEPIPFHNKFVNVYRKDAAGRWKLYMDVYNAVGR